MAWDVAEATGTCACLRRVLFVRIRSFVYGVVNVEECRGPGVGLSVSSAGEPRRAVAYALVARGGAAVQSGCVLANLFCPIIKYSKAVSTIVLTSITRHVKNCPTCDVTDISHNS